jgi:D-glycero-D-manno-heptose 1,7-bisphosphate phosphatase
MLNIVFLDRDGIINKDKNYVFKKEDFEFVEGIFTSCKHFQKLGYGIIVITNQSGIYRGYYSKNDFHVLTKWMVNEFSNNGINILDIFFCPHGPNSICNCRKPKPGMFLEAKLKHNVDIANSWMIGNKETDIKAAYKAGITNTILVKTNHDNGEYRYKPKYIIKSMSEATKIIK